MSSRKRNRFSALAFLPLVLIPAILIGVLLQVRQPPPTTSITVEPPPEADYFLRGAELSTMNAAGELLYRVHAADVLHFPDNRITLSGVDVDYLDGPWTLQARSGELPPQQQTLQLEGDVNMSGHLPSGRRVKLNTARITIAFDEQRIHTEAPLTMQSADIQASAVGMETDLAGRELVLKSRVRVRYAP